MSRIIAIARENGSGGREIGKLLAERYGIPCYDSEIVAKTADVAGISESQAKAGEERATLGKGMFFGGIAPVNPLVQAQAEAVRQLASQGPCVFVGRNADYILRSNPELVTVFVHAPMEARIERSKQRNGFDGKQAMEHINRKDRERADYCMRYTDRVWGMASNYNLCIDTGAIGVEKAAEVIANYIDMM